MKMHDGFKWVFWAAFRLLQQKYHRANAPACRACKAAAICGEGV